MQIFWTERVDEIYKSHRAKLMKLIDEKNFNDVVNTAHNLENIFQKICAEMPEDEKKTALLLLNEKVKKLKESATYKNQRMANEKLDILDTYYFEKAF